MGRGGSARGNEITTGCKLTRRSAGASLSSLLLLLILLQVHKRPTAKKNPISTPTGLKPAAVENSVARFYLCHHPP
jgi:hypothetical protein